MKSILLLIMVGLAGCGVTPEEWAKAERLCKDYEGVGNVIPRANEDVIVMCANGTRFSNIYEIKEAK